MLIDILPEEFEKMARAGFFDNVCLRAQDIETARARCNVETVIPVVSSPSNAFSGFDPPNEEDYHTGKSAAEKLLTAIIILLLVVVVFIVLSPILMPILKPVFSVIGNAVVWVVTAPFKLIGKLFKKKPKETGQIPPQVVVVNPTEYKGVKSPPAPKKKTKTAGNNTSTKANKDGK